MKRFLRAAADVVSGMSVIVGFGLMLFVVPPVQAADKLAAVHPQGFASITLTDEPCAVDFAKAVTPPQFRERLRRAVYKEVAGSVEGCYFLRPDGVVDAGFEDQEIISLPADQYSVENLKKPLVDPRARGVRI